MRVSQSEVYRSATRIKRHVLSLCPRHRLPQSVRGWQQLARTCGLAVGPIARVPWHYQARLWYEDGLGVWVAAYNANHSHRRRRMYIAHELAEYLAITDGEHRTLFDQVTVYGFDGNTDDVRHRIAERFVAICFR